VVFFFLGKALTWPPLFEAFGLINPSVYAGLVVFGVLYTPLSFLLGIPLHAFSRHNEFEADRYAVQTVGDAAPMAQGLRTLAASTLTNLTPHPFYVFLNYTHPPLRERLAALNRS
jgi:STE24 endopeptidase